jgi:hypothetical protein
MGDKEQEFVTRETCAATSSQLLESQEQLLSKLDSIEKRLFRDNGAVSIQTRLDRHEQVQRLLLWIVGAIAGTLLAGCVSVFVMIVRELVRKGAAA